MTKQQFSKLKSQIDRILAQAEDEALKEGILISSQEFQDLLTELKRKLLAEYGISLEEYEQMEFDLETQKQFEEDEIISLGEKTKAFSEARKKEFQQKIDELVSNFNTELQNLSASLKAELDTERKTKLTANDIIRIIKPLIPVVPKHTDFDHTKILQDLNNFEEKINELSNKVDAPEEIWHDEIKGILPDQHHKEKHTLENHLRSEWMKRFEELIAGGNADNLHKHNFPPSRVYAGSGTSESRVKELVGGIETPSGTKDDVNCDFTITHTPKFITFNGQVLYEGSGYSKSGNIITLDVAPSATDILRNHF